MKNIIYTILISMLVCASLATTVQAERISMEQARKVAQGWVTLMIELDGDWGGAATAEIISVEEFKRGNRVLGYYCKVDPHGYLLVSLLRGLAPVKIHSTTDNLDPLLDVGPSDLFKLQFERVLNAVENKYGRLTDIPPEEVEEMVGIEHLSTWELVELEREDLIAEINLRGLRDEYQEGQELLSSCWHQFDPYYVQCPVGSGAGCSDPHCPVGCVATAGAQIMRYWSWPPGRDWPNMPDTLEVASPQAEIDAVAELCHDIGIEVDMDYCSSDDHCASGADTYDMTDVFPIFGYDQACGVVYRSDFDWGDWFDYIIGEVSDNRPIQYRIVGHSIVCDGYRWNPEPQYHMNYGWANNAANIWYVLDDLNQPSPDGTWEDEFMVLGIVPDCALASLLMFVYPRPDFPPFYRYVDRDCIGQSATFSAGQYIQFLPGMKITCISGYVSFLSSAFESRLISYDVTKGIKLAHNGELKLNPGGTVRIDAPPRP
jgi:hypothetical protein